MNRLILTLTHGIAVETKAVGIKATRDGDEVDELHCGLSGDRDVFQPCGYCWGLFLQLKGVVFAQFTVNKCIGMTA